MARKLSKEQVLQIPDLVQEKSIPEIALGWSVHPRTINYQIKKLRAAGIEVFVPKGPRTINLNATSRTENQSG